MEENKDTVELTESTIEEVPGDVLADLLGGGEDAGDPSCRDYGERYTFLGIIGEGGQGVVVKARDNLLEREVAIKALKAPFDSSREDQLNKEARICGVLEHPNILPTYDLNADETGSPFFVMKKIEGSSLEELLRKNADETDNSQAGASRIRLLNIFLQVCNAIEYAHSRGVLHLDIKPDNVHLGPFGEVYVLDWGFAIKTTEKLRLLAGTPIYIAPERFTGRNTDERSDVYSLGVMLYRILTRNIPRRVGKMTFKEYRTKYKEIPIVRPRELDRSIPPDLEAIILKAMTDEPALRYQTVREFADDLVRFMDLQPVSAYEEGPLGRMWKFIRRHKTASVACLMVSIALCTAGFNAWRNYKLEQAILAEKEAVRRRAQARIPLEKAGDLLEKRRERVDKALARSEKNKILQAAFDLFAQAIKKDPGSAAAYYGRGKAHYLARNMDEALADFKKTYDLDSSFIMAHFFAGRIYADVYRKNGLAMKEFEAMKAVDPDNEYSELGQARMAMAERNFDKALAHCERVEKLNPALLDVWYIRGMVYGSKRLDPHYNADKAIAAYNRFLAERHDNPSAFANRGDLRKDMGDIDGAISDYTAALAVNPSYKWARLNRGYLLYKYKNLPEAGLKDMEAVLADNPREFWAYMNRAAIYEALKQPEKAENDYNWAHEIRPDDPIVWYRKGIFFFTQKRLAEAEAAITNSIELSKHSENAVRLHRRGIVRMAMGKYAKAIDDFDESIQLRTSGGIYPALMQWLALKMSGVKPSRKLIAKQLANCDKPWMAALGEYYLNRNKASEVLSHATTPEAACEAHFYLGALDFCEKRNTEAVAHFQKCLGTGFHLYMEFTLADILLNRIKNETTTTGKAEKDNEQP